MNCRRENERSSERASDFARIVFPTPGKSSMIRCPSARRPRTQSSSVSRGARTASSRFATTRGRRTSAADGGARPAPGRVTASVMPLETKPLDLVEHRRRDRALRRLRDRALAPVCQQRRPRCRPRRSRCPPRLTSLKTTRSARFARSFSRARSRPWPDPSAANPTSTCPGRRLAPSAARTSARRRRARPIHGASSFGRLLASGDAGR